MKSENVTPLIAKLTFGHDLEPRKHTEPNVETFYYQLMHIMLKKTQSY